MVLTAYLMRASDGDQIGEAALTAIRYAQEAEVPVVLTLGTRFLIAEDPKWWQEFIRQHVTVLAMNEDEGEALTDLPILCWPVKQHLSGVTWY